MPKGEPKAQTRASQKYQQKVGLISKSYKLRKKLCDDFAEACRIAGTSQSAEITKFMQEFIEQHKE